MATTKKQATKKPAAKKPATAKAPAKRAPQPFSVLLTLGGVKYQATGATPIEAITSLEVRPSNGLRAIVLVTRGPSYRRELILPPYAVSRLFSQSRIMREVALKNMSLLFEL